MQQNSITATIDTLQHGSRCHVDKDEAKNSEFIIVYYLRLLLLKFCAVLKMFVGNKVILDVIKHCNLVNRLQQINAFLHFSFILHYLRNSKISCTWYGIP